MIWTSPLERWFDTTEPRAWIPRSRVRADPVAWMVSLTVGAVIAERKDPDSRTGLMVTSSSATGESLNDIRVQAQTGRVSPRTFAAAGPGTTAALACHIHSLHGPALVITSLAEQSTQDLVPTMSRWLTSGSCERLLLVRHQVVTRNQHLVSAWVGTKESR